MNHPSATVLERLAEEDLSSAESASVRSHIAECMRCAMELEAYEALFVRLGNLHRFAPSGGFADAVMARVQIVPQESVMMAWLRRFAPNTRRGWAFIGSALVVPAIPIIALVVMVLTQPLLSAATISQWGVLRLESMSQASLAWLFDRAVNSSAFSIGESVLASIQNVPTTALGGAIALLCISIPVSAWGLIRLTRTPLGSVTNA